MAAGAEVEAGGGAEDDAADEAGAEASPVGEPLELVSCLDKSDYASP